MLQLNNLTAEQLAGLSMLGKMAGVSLKTVSSTPASNVYGHGNGGLFSAPGLNNQLFSAMMLPNQGLASMLPVLPSIDTHPLYGIVTGVTATSGSEPTGVCDDPPIAGLMKLCTHTAPFGRQSRMTPVIEVNRVGQRTNRGEFLDLQILGGPEMGQFNVPTIPGADFSMAGRNEIAKKLFELAVAWSRDFAAEFYTGNPANNTAGGGREYYNGLDILINTGRVDAITGVACPASDSIVVNANNALIDQSAAINTQIADSITAIYRNLYFIAERAGMLPVQWQLSMRYGLFYALTGMWPCTYYLGGCTAADASGHNINIEGRDRVDLRDQMRAERFLLIDGQRVPVVLDDAIAETAVAGGGFESDIYFVPLTVLGGTRVTYIEYFDYDTANGSLDFANKWAAQDMYFTSDNGRFLWHKRPPEHWCVQLEAKTEPRIVLHTPYLAARMTNIQYKPLGGLHEREPFTDAEYFVNGGQTTYAGYGPSYYGPVG